MCQEGYDFPFLEMFLGLSLNLEVQHFDTKDYTFVHSLPTLSVNLEAAYLVEIENFLLKVL